MQVELTSSHYLCSPLVQDGMEIACLVTVKMPATLKTLSLQKKYLELVKEKYTEPKNKKILCFFVANASTGLIQKTVGKESTKSTSFLKKQPKKWILEKCSHSINVLCCFLFCCYNCFY